MQGIIEAIFDFVYLITVLIAGVWMMKGSKGSKQYQLFGLMAVILGLGDAFHLLPRAYALLTTGLESYTTALGIGKLITSMTMTVFYVILYHIWRLRYGIQGRKNLSLVIYALAFIRIILCIFPQNNWLNYNPSLNWAIYRNIPFAIIGVIMIVIFNIEARKNMDRMLKYMWFAISLSFGFYIPVVLFSHTFPIVGVLMIPKTMAYVWIVLMGLCDLKKMRGTRYS